MKVILTAFCGKLRSEPMDWPDGTGPAIFMTMDMDGPQLPLSTPSRLCIGEFLWDGTYLSSEGVSAACYRLVNVQERVL